MTDIKLKYQTIANPDLIHQVHFTTSDNRTYVSCNCRRTPGEHSKAGKLTYKHIGESRGLDEARALYNNPENHFAPFGKEDEAKW